MNVSRYNDTIELRFDVLFVTPCFLGGADGNAEIRTAPFKNLLRRWWRIVNGELSSEKLWRKESELFGSTEKNSETKNIFGKSRVILKIISAESNFSYQADTRLREPSMTIKHPEVQNAMSFESYLGMGPVFWNKDKRVSEYKNKPVLEYTPEKISEDKKTHEKIISEKEKGFIRMSLTIPAVEKETFVKIISYIHYLGTIGSRSRNSWGSLFIRNLSSYKDGTEIEKISLLTPKTIKENSKNWLDILSTDKYYPFAIACDEKGLLCWSTPQHDTWQEVMQDLANVYVKVRTQFAFNNADGNLHERHLLGYPVTHHSVNSWKKDDRLPSQIIMKVNFNNGKYNGRIYHLPNLIALKGFLNSQQKEIWKKVYEFLDSTTLKNDKGEDKKLGRFGGTVK